MSQLGISQSPELEPREDWAAGAPAEEDLVPLPCASVDGACGSGAVAVVRCGTLLGGAVVRGAWRPTSRVQKCGYEPTRTF